MSNYFADNNSKSSTSSNFYSYSYNNLYAAPTSTTNSDFYTSSTAQAANLYPGMYATQSGGCNLYQPNYHNPYSSSPSSSTSSISSTSSSTSMHQFNPYTATNNQENLGLNLNISPSAPMPYLFSHIDPQLDALNEPQRAASASSASSVSPLSEQTTNKSNGKTKNTQDTNSNNNSLLLDDSNENSNSTSQNANGTSSSGTKPVIYAWMKKVHVNNTSIIKNNLHFILILRADYHAI